MFFGELKGLIGARCAKRAQQWCERLGLNEWTGKKVEELSKGMQQKVQFIGAVVHDPQFVVMDEPFSGLDPSSAVVLKDAFLEFEESGKTLLFSTHRMDTGGAAVRFHLPDQSRARRSGRRSGQDHARDTASATCRSSTTAMRGFCRNRNWCSRSTTTEIMWKCGWLPGADPQELLQAASARARLSKFEVMEPSLEEIFIEAVSKPMR